MTPIALAAAAPADEPAVRALLREVGLPCGGLERAFPPGFVVARAGPSGPSSMLVGCAGVERHGDDGLLRSVAVAPAARRQGLGRELVADRRAWAAARRMTALYLLTTDAAEFFAALGFVAVARGEVAAAIQASEEFAAICPRSATCMVVRL